jgi:branched-chain amino acid transport system ATP-binding protein
MLKIDNIETFYGKIQALKGISFNIDKGEIVSLIGANGAGKTTTLLTISGIIKPKKGEIYFNDQRIDNLPPDKIVSLGISIFPFPIIVIIIHL